MEFKANAGQVLQNVKTLIEELESSKSTGWIDLDSMMYKGTTKCYRIGAVCEELSIFDWWADTLSLTQLKQMKKFLEQAIKLGFTGYVCFKVGVKHCSHGMWAHKKETETGYSPDGDVLYHSFVPGSNYFDAEINGIWYHEGKEWEETSKTTFRQIESFVKGGVE